MKRRLRLLLPILLLGCGTSDTPSGDVAGPHAPRSQRAVNAFLCFGSVEDGGGCLPGATRVELRAMDILSRSFSGVVDGSPVTLTETDATLFVAYSRATLCAGASACAGLVKAWDGALNEGAPHLTLTTVLALQSAMAQNQCPALVDYDAGVVTAFLPLCP